MQTTHNVTYHANHTQCDIPCKPHTMRHTMQTTRNVTYHANNTQCDIPCKQHATRTTLRPGPDPRTQRARGGAAGRFGACARARTARGCMRRCVGTTANRFDNGATRKTRKTTDRRARRRPGAVVLEGGAGGGPARGNTHAHTHTHTHTHTSRDALPSLSTPCVSVWWWWWWWWWCKGGGGRRACVSKSVSV